MTGYAPQMELNRAFTLGTLGAIFVEPSVRRSCGKAHIPQRPPAAFHRAPQLQRLLMLPVLLCLLG